MKTIYYHFGYPLSANQVCPLITAAGFDGTSFWWSDEYDPDYRSHPEIARKSGLLVENVHTSFENANSLWLDNLDGETLIEYYLRCVNDCAEFEIPTMVMHLSRGNTPPPYNAIGLDRIKMIADKAEQLGVNVAVENMRKTAYLAYVLGQVDSPRIGFCYDSGHHHCHSKSENLLSQYGLRLMALHLHDNKGFTTGENEDDQHKLPFDGTIDWFATMKKIEQTGYSGATALEIVNLGYENLSPEEFLHLAFERAEKLEALRC